MATQVSMSYKHCPKCLNQTCHERIQDLIATARKHPAGSRERNRYLTQIIREISPRLWHTNSPHYPDALQQTWRLFVERVCTSFDSTRGCVISWLNSYLWYRHQDLLRQSLKHQQHELPIDQTADAKDGWYGTVRDVSTRDYGSLALLNQVLQWVKTDPDHALRCTYVKNRPEINAQALILLRLPPETPWKEISTQFNISIPTLSAFYQRKCLPLLRNFGQSQGFL